mmetsp:Transcript_7957/g.11968  ORF Transcript_7957/g.11968 Transcript_7957/m.11968 type:complete len:370 (-) Transcript_7957:156-1265(-)|eukprot:CAMPEP_0196142674 /NCGR_PEP_ID=MMETSP0910-20130528/12066_1 /TAXON_ID=49265 /ORGANISM="Thalassiosira rotula, Strain GSO102" /LENGTH=369 /DNA_ID=CAMNT_0041404019 /DNA_START=163 /DNA_END=1272 /DNA_ORIENTATION=+
MGNVAIAFIQHSLDLTDSYRTRRQKRIEHKRIRSLIPRYLARLNDRDISINTLNLDGLGVDSQILRLLSGPLISGETRVMELYLQNNWIGPEGATCIARILSKDNYLRHVSLAHNPVGNVGVMAIASALEQNATLEKLDLSHCDIDDGGIRKLALSLKSNTRLKYLHLEGNYISSVGISCLMKCVYDTASMQSLWESNHTLRAFWGRGSPYSPSFPETSFNRQLVRQLGEILAACNRRYSEPVLIVGNYSSSSSTASAYASTRTKRAYKIRARIAACKILRHYIREKMLEYWECVESMEEKLVPNVIAWLVNYGDVGVIYGVVKDMPWLLEKKLDRDGNLVLVDENARSTRMDASMMVERGRMEDAISQ